MRANRNAERQHPFGDVGGVGGRARHQSAPEPTFCAVYSKGCCVEEIEKSMQTTLPFLQRDPAPISDMATIKASRWEGKFAMRSNVSILKQASLAGYLPLRLLDSTSQRS